MTYHTFLILRTEYLQDFFNGLGLRVWIIQELAVLRDAIVMDGPCRCSCRDFIIAVDYAAEKTIPFFWETHTLTRRIHNIEKARQAIEEGKNDMLLTLLLSYRTFNASNLRDKAYGFVG